MKKIRKIQVSLLMFIIMMAFCMLPMTASSQDEGPVNTQYFYDYLSPYGVWVSSITYGTVWVPNVSRGFRPYFSNGYWEYTEYGWMWISLYDWGWASFHYGYWALDPDFGWIWIPGYDWAPAWVVWGYYSGYCGWAPAGPGMFNTWPYYPPCNYWVFVPPSRLNVSGWNNQYFVARDNKIRFKKNNVLTEVTNIKIDDNKGTYHGVNFLAGPTKTTYETMTKNKLVPVEVKEQSMPGKEEINGNVVNIYRPEISTEDKNTAKPAKIVTKENLNEYKPARSYENENMKGVDIKNNNAPEQNIKGTNEKNKFEQEPQMNRQERQQYEQKQTKPQQVQPQRNEMKMPSNQQGRKANFRRGGKK